MSEIIKWFAEHWSDVLGVIGALITAATIIVKLTPTQKDDAVLAKIIKVLAALSLCNPDGSFVGKGKTEAPAQKDA